jgi:hypothetical protein
MVEGSTMALLQMIARADERSLAISRVVCRLVKDGRELGEVRSEFVVVDGIERPVLVMPEQWVDRLVLAAERGAFERMPEDRIVERLLSPPVPA